MKGIYTLILEVKTPIRIEVGSLGAILFRKGAYAYVGSARGPGGLSRVGRHVEVARGRNQTRKWHIDYLLPHASVVAVVVSPTEEDLECGVARRLGEIARPVPGFGSSDCPCDSHLFFYPSVIDLEKAVREIHKEVVGVLVRLRPS